MSETVPQNEIAKRKEILVYLRHLTTLCTGSILLIVTFLEKLFANPELKGLVIVSMFCFLIAILGALIAQFLIAGNLNVTAKKIAKSEAYVSAYAVLVAWIGFFCGVISLAVFAIKNL